MKKLVLFIFVFQYYVCIGQALYFPPTNSTDWTTTSADSLSWNVSEIDALYQFLDSTNTNAFIILKDGKIVLENYFGTFNQDSLSAWNSAGKSMMSFLVGKAQEDGFLNTTDRTADYLGEGWTSAPLAKENLITINHQLTMSTGLDDQYNFFCIVDTCLLYKSDAGTRWAYHNGPYTLLRNVIIEATGNPFFNNYSRTVLENKIGMDGFWLNLNSYNIYYSTPRSMARFGLLILANGQWDSQTIMSDTSYLQSMLVPSQTLNPAYGKLWWLNGQSAYMNPGLQFLFPGPLNPHAPADLVSAIGKNGQYLDISPSEKLIVIRMGNASDNNFVPINYQRNMWKKIRAVTDGYSSTPEEINITANTIELLPNPCTDFLKITGYTEDYDIDILNVNGQIHESIQNISNPYYHNISSLPAGMFFVRIFNKNAQTMKIEKIIKMH